MVFSWRADDGPLLALFGSSRPIRQKNLSEMDASGKTYWIRTCFWFNSPLVLLFRIQAMPYKKDDYEDKPHDHPLADCCLFHMCIKWGPKTYMHNWSIFVCCLLKSIEMGRGGGRLHDIVSQMTGRSMWKNVKDNICRINSRIKSAAGMHHNLQWNILLQRQLWKIKYSCLNQDLLFKISSYFQIKGRNSVYLWQN